MAYTRPDLYVEEVLSAESGTSGVSTSVASFVGVCEKGPTDKATLITSFEKFKSIFGSAVKNETMYYSVRSFFANGGAQCYVVRVATNGSAASQLQVENAATSVIGTFSAGFMGSKSVGLHGNELKLTIAQSGDFTSNYELNTSTDLQADAALADVKIEVASIVGLQTGDVVKITNNEKDSATTFVVHTIKSVSSAVVGGAIKHYITLNKPLAGALTAADSKIQLIAYDLVVSNSNGEQLETWDRLNFNPESIYYFGTVLNDENFGSKYITFTASSETLTDSIIDAANVAANQEFLGGTTAVIGLSATEVIAGFDALSGKSSVNLLCVPPSSADATNGNATSVTAANLPVIHVAMLEYCSNRMDMFALLDAPLGKTPAQMATYRSSTIGVDNFWGAMYYPHITVLDEDGVTKLTVPPSGSVAGLYSRVDAMAPPEGSVSTSPAGYGDFGLLKDSIGVETEVSASQHGDLNVVGVNCIRRINQASGSLPGTVVLGARTLSYTVDFKYINVRRMMTFIEQSVVQLARPYLFKNNNSAMRTTLSDDIEFFLRSLLDAGQLFGTTPADSFFVKIDDSINKIEDVKNGILNAEIGVALSRPAEFIVFKFSQSPLGGTTVVED